MSATQKDLFSDGYTKDDLLQALFAMERSKPTVRIKHPSDVYPRLLPWCDSAQEHFIVTTLNGAHDIVGVHVVSVGLVNRTLVHPREIFRVAILDNAVGIIVAHNHPSGHLDPSTEDRAVTTTLQDAGELIGIRVLDHLVFSSQGYYSFVEHGEL